MYLDASVRVGFPWLFSFYLYDAIGPEVEPEPYLELRTDTTQTPTSELRLGLSVGARFALSKLLGGRELFRKDDLLDFFVTIWHSPTSGIRVETDHPDDRTKVGEPVQFGVRGFGGLPDVVPAHWRVLEGVGTIDDTGRYVSDQVGHAIVQAVPQTLQEEPVVAGVNVGPNVPTPPRNARAGAGRLSADVAWTPPVLDGGTPITGYAVTTFPATGTVFAPPDTASVRIRGLAPGVRYSFEVRALNAVGTSAAATTGAVKERAGAGLRPASRR